MAGCGSPFRAALSQRLLVKQPTVCSCMRRSFSVQVSTALFAGKRTSRSGRLGTGSKAKNEWLRRQARDPYVRQVSSGFVRGRGSMIWLTSHAQAQEQGLRSRACFKLIHINEVGGEELYAGGVAGLSWGACTQKFRLLRPGMQVVDLGSAPGGWLQVAAQQVLRPHQLVEGECEVVSAVPPPTSSPAASTSYGTDDADDDAVSFFSLQAPQAEPQMAAVSADPEPSPSEGKAKFSVVGIDLLPVAPLAGTAILQGDFTDPAVRRALHRRMRRRRADIGRLISWCSPGRQPRRSHMFCCATVLSDMAHSFLGFGATDHTKQLELADLAFTFALKVQRMNRWYVLALRSHSLVLRRCVGEVT